MNYCCEAYASLYVNSCRWRDHGVWPHGGCEAYSPQLHLILKHRELLLEDPTAEFLKDTELKPKSKTCPFCEQSYDGRGPSARDPQTDMVWVTLKDAPGTKGAVRHIAQPPDMEVGAGLARWLRS